jgi:aspartyl-tRNA(Asn)/glutamyl-tRNA(Gln) amidotransferase subunit A
VNQITELTLAEAGDQLRSRSVSSAELLDATLALIEETEPFVHAYAGLMTESARSEAAQADNELREGRPRGPLHGIPIGVKDLCYTKGFPTEAGSDVLAGFVPDIDATVVTKLRQAGAVLIGKTVTHEFAYGQNVPATRNAWDTSRYPGGSSAGSGVAVAIGTAFGAIGTDTGGSIRAPSSVNGVVGLKPTFGRVSRRGVVAMSASMDTVGPLARTVRDCALLLGAIAGGERNDNTASSEPVLDYAQELTHPVEEMTVGIERRFFFPPESDPEINATFDQAVDVVDGLGVNVVEVEIPELEYATPAGVAVVVADTSDWHREFLRERAAKYVRDTRIMLELGELMLAPTYIRAQKVRRHVQQAVRRVFDEHGLAALAAPTIPIPTPTIDELLADTAVRGDIALSLLLRQNIFANVIGVPSLSVPCGFTEDGMPIGMQLVGRPFDETTLFRLGHAYETQTDWHTRRPTPHLART